MLTRLIFVLGVIITACIVLVLIDYEEILYAKTVIVEKEVVRTKYIYLNNTVLEYKEKLINNTVTVYVDRDYVPPLDLLSITPYDEDTSDQWQDDDGNLRYVTLMYKPTVVESDLNNVRRAVGSIHHFEQEQIKTTIFGFDVPEDFYLEIRTFSFVRFIRIPAENASSLNDARDYVMSTSRTLYARFLFIDSMQKVWLRREGLAKRISEDKETGPILVAFTDGHSEEKGFIRGSGSGVSIIFYDYLEVNEKDNDEFGRCALFRNISSPYRIKHIYSHHNKNFLEKETRHGADDRLICLSIATYAGSNGANINVDDFSLMNKVMPSFLTSTADEDTPTSRYRFAMYLGLQRDKFYDDPAKLEDLKSKIIAQTESRSFSLRLFYTPLNAPAMDIAYKWNVLIEQGYRDMCDYIYQYSDDTVFVTPWVNTFVTYLESESNFGMVGATDTNNKHTMTLAFSHRNHITVLGSFWPTHLKNWFSDDWAQQVYGERYTKHFSEVVMQNTQQQGQRYPACGHGQLMNYLKVNQSRPQFVAWLKQQPQTYDIRQKLDYYENRHGEGAKKK
jgi:hypothetical protein